MKKNLKDRITLNPIITYLLIIGFVILLSGFLSLLGVSVSYNKMTSTGAFVTTSEAIESLFSLSGLKYIFSSTVSNFASFAPLVNLIIVLFGIGIMEKSGFLKTAFTLLTKKAKKTTVTFVLAFICIMASIVGDLGYVILIPLSALLFLHGKRNPLLGIITAFAGLTCSAGLNVFLTSIDSTLRNATILSAKNLDPTYNFGSFAFLFIMIIASLLLAFIITKISENIIAPKLKKYEFAESEEVSEIGKQEQKGLIFAIGAGVVYLVFFVYNIIPGLPFSGNLLDNSQLLYIDKLFSPDAFFSNGFVFIVTILFVIWGFFYGLGAKTIKNNNDVADYLGHSLDGTGKMIVLIFFASAFINIVKRTNIGPVITAWFASIISQSAFQGTALIILVFLLVAIATIFLPSSTGKWAILSGVTIPILIIFS